MKLLAELQTAKAFHPNPSAKAIFIFHKISSPTKAILLPRLGEPAKNEGEKPR